MQLALEHFDDAHVLVNADGRFWWQPLAAPRATDDSRSTHTMLLLRKVHDDLVRRPTKKAKADRADG